MGREKSLSELVICCGFEVSNTLGVGFLEAVYENALCVELERQGIQCHQQKQLKVMYKDRRVGNYIADIVIENKLLLELKTVTQVVQSHKAQYELSKSNRFAGGFIIKLRHSKVRCATNC